MRLGTLSIQAVAGLAVLVACAPAARSVQLYVNDFEQFTPGPGLPAVDSFFNFNGEAALVHSSEVTDTDGVDDSNSYKETADSSGSTADGYFYAGFGQFAYFADELNPLPGAPLPESNDPAMYTLDLDIKVMGHSTSTPVELLFQAVDSDYDTATGMDGNGNGAVDGAAVWVAQVFPTLSVGNNDWQHVSVDLTDGTTIADMNVPTPFFNNELSFQWILAYNNGGFGFDSGNMVSVDNVRIEYIGSVPEGTPGDYNEDGTVNAADYVVWRNVVGTSAELPNRNPDLTGDIAEGDYQYWVANFSDGGQGASVATAVPEPMTVVLSFTALATLGVLIRKRS